MLAAQRIGELDRVEHFRREEREARELELLAFRERVAKLEHPVVRDTDHVARIGFLQQLAPLRQERDHVVRSQLLAVATDLHLHAAHEAARTDPHESDAVPMGGIHVRLDLEYDAGEFLFGGLHHALHGGLGARRRRKLDQRVEHLPHTEIVDGGAEENRRLPAGEEGLTVERR